MKKITGIFFVVLFSLNLVAQESTFGVNYNIMLTSADLKDDFIKDPSFRGFSFEYKYFLSEGKISLGGEVGWSIFNEVIPKTTYFDTIEGVAINAKTWRYMHVVPITPTAHYYFLDRSSKINVYAGLGLGLYYVRQEFWISTLEISKNLWRFGFFPEAGMKINLSETVGLQFSARYQMVVKGDQIGRNRNNNLQNWGFKMGIVIIN